MPSSRGSLDRRAAELMAQFDTFARRFIIRKRIAARDRTPLTRLELRVLATLAERPHWPVGELARYLMMPLSSLSSLLDRLAAKQLVSRRRSPDDRRVVCVEPTPRGRTAAARFRRHRLSIARGMLQALTEEEGATFIALMHKIGTQAGGGDGRKEDSNP